MLRQAPALGKNHASTVANEFADYQGQYTLLLSLNFAIPVSAPFAKN
jgi:hypothetical protein